MDDKLSRFIQNLKRSNMHLYLAFSVLIMLWIVWRLPAPLRDIQRGMLEVIVVPCSIFPLMLAVMKIGKFNALYDECMALEEALYGLLLQFMWTVLDIYLLYQQTSTALSTWMVLAGVLVSAIAVIVLWFIS